MLTLRLAEDHSLTARRIHDARHAAIAIKAKVSRVYTYDATDWRCFETDGLKIVGPKSVVEGPHAEAQQTGDSVELSSGATSEQPEGE